MGRTKRLQNRCKACNYTWYPKGKNLSNKCPNCGSPDVTYAGTGCAAIVAIGLIGIFGLSVFSVSTTSSDRTPTPTQPSQPSATPIPVVSASPVPASTARPRPAQAPVPPPDLSALEVFSDQTALPVTIVLPRRISFSDDNGVFGVSAGTALRVVALKADEATVNFEGREFKVPRKTLEGARVR